MRRLPVLAVLLGVLAAGCAGGEPAAPGETWAELGTGEWEFVSLTDEQEVDLIFGSQGGYHVWASIRTEGLDPSRVMLEVETQVGDDSRPAEHSRVPVDLEVDEVTGVQQFIGWPAVLAHPGCAVDRMIRVHVTLTDRRGVVAGDECYVMPRLPDWAPPPPTCE